MSRITLEMDVNDYIDLLDDRRREVRENFGWTIPDGVYDYFCEMLEDGVAPSDPHPRFVIDNMAINGDYGPIENYGLLDRFLSHAKEKYLEVMSEKLWYNNKHITNREMIELMIFEKGAFPVLIPKGEKGNKKPFDIYELNYCEKNHNDNLTVFCVKLKKIMYQYADYLHGEKKYVVTTKDGESNIKECVYVAKSPLDAIRKHCEEIGVIYSELTNFSSKTGICRGAWGSDGVTSFTAYELMEVS